VERATDASFSALDISYIKMDVLVKGKRLLWAYESYCRHLLLERINFIEIVCCTGSS
jgi:hypothetical protein